MGLSVYMAASRNDYHTMSQYILHLGLRTLPILLSQPEILASDDPAAYPFAYLSPLPRDALHPYGTPKRIGAATDPLLEFLRPYLRSPSELVVGRLYCSNDVPELFLQTKPYFMQLRKWTREHWEKLPTGQYIGPEGKLLLEKGARLAYFQPGIPIETRIIDGPSDSGMGA